MSRYNRETQRQIKLLVGPSFSWRERLKMRGIGSPRMQIVESSSPIRVLSEKHNNTSYANIELRPHGILVGFKAILETWIWAIPYPFLKIEFDGQPVVISDGKEYMHLIYPKQETEVLPFIHKLLRTKNTYAAPS